MHLSTLDWVIMATSFAIYLAIGLFVGRSSAKDYTSYFLSGRSMPWWLLGTSMVATTFATDTPGLVAGIVRQKGVAGNWMWWSFLLTGVTTVFFFAKLWRRSGLMTDVEFYELRYSGTPAAFLRGFRAVYLGFFFNLIVMATVTLAAIKIGGVMLGLSPLQTITIASVVTLAYSAVGGLTSVLLTDLVQFIIAMVGSVWAAWYVMHLPQVGGWSQALARPEIAAKLAIIPDFSTADWQTVVIPVFLMPLLVQWWSIYYPSAEPGGGGYLVQRILAAKNEKHAAGAALFFNLMHYAIRPWPWIVIGLCSLVVFPDLASLQKQFPNMDPKLVQHDLAYPAMLTFLPPGLMGVVVTSLIAAYMSTMSTQVNWGSSILVNDVWKRFIAPESSDHQQVRVGQAVTVVLMVAACGLALLMEDSISNFQLLLEVGAGTGLIFLLRWFWWRINAAAELTAMVVSFACAVFFFVLKRLGIETSLAAWQQMLTGIGITTAAWLLVAFFTPATDSATLRKFYLRIQPSGPGWKPVLDLAAQDNVQIQRAESSSDFPAALLGASATTAMVWSLIFAGGYAVYGKPLPAALCAALALLCGGIIKFVWPRLKWS